MTRRVVFLCCHLSGTGHLVRTLALARAVRAEGGRVTVISGGRPLGHLDTGGLDLVQLPPVTVPDFDFATLRRPDGTPADRDWMAARRAALAAALSAAGPATLVTELFPLGRRRLADEFLFAIRTLRAADPRTPVLASVRDVPEPPRRPDRVAEAARRIAEHYDGVLVHGDPGLIALEASWPGIPADHLGYVAEPPPPAAGPPVVLVSGGGGVLGRQLLEVAARAARLTALPWHLIAGGPDAAEEAARLARTHDVRATQPLRDYRARLAAAAVSVSLAGYNTVTDLAPIATPAVLVPFAEHGEREQSLRAAALARFPGVTVLDPATLTPERLARAVAAAHRAGSRPPLPLALDGARAAALRILSARRRSLP